MQQKLIEYPLMSSVVIKSPPG